MELVKALDEYIEEPLREINKPFLMAIEDVMTIELRICAPALILKILETLEHVFTNTKVSHFAKLLRNGERSLMDISVDLTQ
jgi:hypothetical protein